ncbi:MAG: hypothetical protein J0L78_00380 [Planctomycetes bacterium]|nr:hypothetical protein [Planctomycetota bacterium]
MFTPTSHFVSVYVHRCAALSCVIALLGLGGCTFGSNAPEVRQREAALIPLDLYQLAPYVAVAVSPLHTSFEDDHIEFTSENGGTGTLLPNNQMLTAAHTFRKGFDLAKKPQENSFTVPNPHGGEPLQMTIAAYVYPILINSSAQFASVVAFEPADRANGDWVLFSLKAPHPPILDGSLANSPLSIRFDGTKMIKRGTPLYCLGFPKTPGTNTGITSFPRSMTIVQGTASRDLGADEEIEADTDTEIDMRGMSGGPVGTYDFWNREFTVVGTATHGSVGFRFLGQRVWSPQFVASRIPPVALQRLAGPKSPAPPTGK